MIEHGSKIGPIMIGMYLSDMRKILKKYFIYLCIYYAYSNIADFDYFLNAGYGYYNIDRYLTFFCWDAHLS